MSGAGGLGAGFSFDDKGQLSSRMELGQFAPFLEALLGTSQNAYGRAEGLDGLYGDMQRQAGALGGVFDSASKIASMDPLERGGQITDLLRQRRAGGAQNLIRDTFDRLFQSGGLSNSVVRNDVTDATSRQLADEDLGFQLAGINQGEQSVQNAFARMLGAQQGQTSGLTAVENLRNMMMNQGMSALGGAQNIANMPMQLMQMLGGLQAQRSNTQLGIAAGHQGNAQLAESTFLNFVNFMNNQQQQMNQNLLTMNQVGGSAGGFMGLGG